MTTSESDPSVSGGGATIGGRRVKTLQHVTSYAVRPFGLVRVRWLEGYPRLKEANISFEAWLMGKATRFDEFLERHQRIIVSLTALFMVVGTLFLLWALGRFFSHR